MRSSARTIHSFDSGGDDLRSDASLGPGFFITQWLPRTCPNADIQFL
jgi:hypothetical protein